MTNSKKIAVVCNYALYPNRIGGMDRFWVAYDKKAKELGYEIHWYFSDYETFDFFSELTIYSDKNQNVESFFLEKVTQEHLKYDILVTHFVALCTSFFKKVRHFGIHKTIAVDHNPRPLNGFSLSKVVKNKIKGFLYSGYINQFVGVSDYTRKHILKDYGFFLKSKTLVIYNGIDTSVFIKRKTVNRNKFITTSHLRYSKGIQDLIQAVAVLESYIQCQIQIDIYGEGTYEKHLVEMSKVFNLESIFHFKGSSSQLNELYANYSYLIQPSHEETFCYSVIESLVSNLPVITTHEAGNVLHLIEQNKNGFLYNVGNFQQLSEILKNVVLGNFVVDKDVSTEIVDKFNLEKMVNEHIQLLKWK